MQIVGYDNVGGQLFPRLSGPCKGCGTANYGLSTSGPDYCGACACGTPPEVSRLRREIEALREKYMDALLALQIASGHKAEHMTQQMRERGDKYLAQFKAEPNLNSPWGIGTNQPG